MGSLSNILQQFREEGIAICHNVYLIVLERQGEVLIDKEVNQGFLALRHVEVVLLDEVQHRSLGEFIHLTLTDDTFLAVVYAEEQIKHHADNRNEANDQYPRHRLGWLTVVHQHMNNGNGCRYYHQCISYVY